MSNEKESACFFFMESPTRSNVKYLTCFLLGTETSIVHESPSLNVPAFL
jgi:hypothetical protein